MDRLREYLARFKPMVLRAKRLRLPAVGAIAFSALLALVGGIWLIASRPDAQMRAIPGLSFPPEDAQGAAGLLEKRGIACRVQDGRLLVASDDHPAARAALLKGNIEAPANRVDTAEPVERDSIWLTAAERQRRSRRRQAARLSTSIGSLREVRSATVFLAPGRPRGLGHAAVGPRASVVVRLSSPGTMPPRLVRGITDLVVGSISDMRPADVRIVDGAGRSYASPEGGDGPADRRARAEAHHAERIRGALEFIPGAVITVDVDDDRAKAGSMPPCLSASVSIPRGYLVAACPSIRGRDTQTQLPKAFIADQLAAVRRKVARVAGIADSAKIVVEWHHDVAPAVVAQSPHVVSSAQAVNTWQVWAAAAALCGLLVGTAVTWGWMRRARQRAAADTAVRVPSDPPGSVDEEQDPLRFLRDLPAEAILAMMREEHPQAIALILSQLGPGKAAAVLAGLSPESQVDVIRRIAGLEKPNLEVTREIVRGLAERMGPDGQRGENPDGVSVAAEILQESGQGSEAKLLDGLSDREPALADSIRREMFEFDDMLTLADGRLREALASAEVDEIAVALRAAGRDIRKKILTNLSRDRLAAVRDEMEQIGPVRLSDVEAAQQRLASVVRRSAAGRYVSATSEETEILA